MSTLYGPDLAQIHVDGYGFHWQRAAPAILKWLRAARIERGRVVDLGCGGGQWLARLSKAGYEPVGIDASREMIRLARLQAPTATLIRGSFADVELPPSRAVTALGEPLNYLDGSRSVRRTLRRVHQALTPGGLFVFDVREPSLRAVERRVAARVGINWACVAEIDEPPGSQRLIRQITTFRRRGETYHRAEERHELRLFPRVQMLSWLQWLGFRVRVYRGYGEYRLGPRQAVIVARK